jgi:hypothetical protein
VCVDYKGARRAVQGQITRPEPQTHP